MKTHTLRQLEVVAVLSLAVLLLAGCATSAVPAPVTVAPVVSETSVAQAPVPPTLAPTATTPPAEKSNAQPGAAGLGDSRYPGFGNGGYDVQHYTLDLTVNAVDTGDLNGVVIIEANALQDLSRFNLDFIGFTIDQLRVNGQPAQFERQGQEFTIVPAQAVVKDERFTIEVQYHGRPQEVDSAALPEQVGWIVYHGGSYVLSEPDGAATYFPANDHPLDKATYTFRVTVPNPFEVAANGVLSDTIDHGATTTYVWDARQPMASYLSTVNIGEFDEVIGESPAGVPLRDFYPAGSRAAVREPFEREGEMLDFYSDTFGPYPFDAYGSLVIDDEVGTALETQTLSIFGRDMLDEYTVAHELSHQWFGDSVSVGDWGDIWLNEGFATYAEGLWIEHTESGDALSAWVQDIYQGVAKAGRRMVPPGDPPANKLFNAGVYYRGALTLHALRLEIGDEAFFDLLRTYYDRFKGGVARTSDFTAMAEEISGQDLQTFFDGWLYADQLPPIPALGLSVE